MFHAKPTAEGEEPLESMMKSSGLVSKGSTVLVAMAFCKLLVPIKVPLTVALTPSVARLVARLRQVA
jgi:hypothetical protein